MANDPHLGRTLGNVRLVERLGAGAMGVVYRAHHLALNRDVAVKLLLAHAQEKAASYRERFLREGRAAARVHNPNVVQVIDAGQADGIAYLVMELIDGPSLGRILDSKGTLPAEAIIRIGIGIADGLAAIHAAGVIHRDIKPDNILIGSDAVPRITDLGLAKQVEDRDALRLTATGVVVGTPLYVSPEAIRDPRSVTPAADIYSLGATLYHLATGHSPFERKTAYEVMRGHLEERLRPVREINQTLPKGLAELIERCLAKAPDKRPTATELSALLAGQGRSRASLNKGLAAFVGAVALVVLAAAAGGFALLGHRRAPPREAIVAGEVRVLGDAARLRARIDGGEWRAIDGALALAAGTHRLLVEADQPGPTRQWQGNIDVPAGGKRDVTAALATVPVPEARVAFPGEGMLFRDGVAYGADAMISFPAAGRYAVTRAERDGWLSATITVDATGAQSSPPTASSLPGDDAYWRRADERGTAMTPHHVACWWEVERARSVAGLPAPLGWREQAQRPEQPAVQLDPALVAAAASRAGGYARLPGRGEALKLTGELRAPLWCSGEGRLDVVGGAPAAATLVLVPVRK